MDRYANCWAKHLFTVIGPPPSLVSYFYKLELSNTCRSLAMLGSLT